MKQFTIKQMITLRLLGLAFTFQACNIKFCIQAFESDKKTYQADKLVKQAEELGDLIQNYVIGAIPNGVHGDIREQYEKYGRALTLTDYAASWLAANQNNLWPPIPPETAVKTLRPNEELRKEWTEESWDSRQWGVEGKIIKHHDAHGLSYEVSHPDHTIGHYDPSEIEVL